MLGHNKKQLASGQTKHLNIIQIKRITHHSIPTVSSINTNYTHSIAVNRLGHKLHVLL